MANQTARNKFNIFLENDVVDFEQINANFEKLDGMCLCTESGTKAANYTGTTSGSILWRYKKYADNTVEMDVKLEFGNIKCNGGSAAPYYSGQVTVYFPFNFSDVYNIQMHMTSNTVGWVQDITAKGSRDSVTFKVLSMTNESVNVYKEISLSVKGVLE